MATDAFDYVIVGAGSAGCVVASRLSEDPHVRVLLLEAGGPDRKLEIGIPAAFSKLFKTAYDWAYETEPEPHCGGRRLYWPRGKTLGGSSSLNAMIYIRGARRDYDRWEALGAKGWGYADVLPAFRQAEDQARGASEHHGTGGPLRVEDLRCVNPLSDAFVAAGAELGLPRVADFNGPEPDGVGLYQVTQKRGRRHSAAAAYLHPARRRPNLTVRTGAHTTRLTGERGRITGVAYVAGGPGEVRAEREVIVSAGAVGSPQLLLLSGIGPGGELARLGIPVVADLPGVGENLQDHLAVAVAWACTRPISLVNAERTHHLLRYLLLRAGPLTSNVAEAGGFVRTRPELATPDLQLHFAPAYFLDHGFANPPGHGFTIGPTLLYPASRGRLVLRSRDPLAAPRIQANYLAAEADVRVLVDGVALARRLGQTRALTPFRGREVWPGEDVQGESAVAEFVRRRVQTLYHPVGTCRMAGGPLGVVDNQLRVLGVEGLRVVDASVMPAIVGGNTNAPTIMIAERASALIREPV